MNTDTIGIQKNKQMKGHKIFDGPRIKHEVALITGAAGGIGFELARLATADCRTVILVDMAYDRLLAAATELRKLHRAEIVIILKDLSKQDAGKEVFNEIRELKLDVDLLINNAGIAYLGYFAETDWEKTEDVLFVNVVNTTSLTKFFVDDMLKRGKGSVLNIASTAAFQPGPLMSVYYASKVYLLSFSQSIAEEVRNRGISITVFCPGPTKTGFQKSIGNEGNFLSRWNRLASAPKMAEKAYRAMQRGKGIVIPGGLNKLIVFIEKFIPGRFLARAMMKLQMFNRGAAKY